MKGAVSRVFPGAIPHICIFHVNKNIVLNIKRKWDKQSAARVVAAHTAVPISQRNSGVSSAAAPAENDPINDDDLDEEDIPVVTRLNDIHRKGREAEVGPLPPPDEIEYSRAGVYQLWAYIIYAYSTTDFKAAWAKLKEYF